MSAINNEQFYFNGERMYSLTELLYEHHFQMTVSNKKFAQVHAFIMNLKREYNFKCFTEPHTNDITKILIVALDSNFAVTYFMIGHRLREEFPKDEITFPLTEATIGGL